MPEEFTGGVKADLRASPAIPGCHRFERDAAALIAGGWIRGSGVFDRIREVAAGFGDAADVKAGGMLFEYEDPASPPVPRV